MNNKSKAANENGSKEPKQYQISNAVDYFLSWQVTTAGLWMKSRKLGRQDEDLASRCSELCAQGMSNHQLTQWLFLRRFEENVAAASVERHQSARQGMELHKDHPASLLLHGVC